MDKVIQVDDEVERDNVSHDRAAQVRLVCYDSRLCFNGFIGGLPSFWKTDIGVQICQVVVMKSCPEEVLRNASYVTLLTENMLVKNVFLTEIPTNVVPSPNMVYKIILFSILCLSKSF